jgi:hypothetical protein
MPYQIHLTTKDGRAIGRFKIYQGATPKVGDVIKVDLDDGQSVDARVGSIAKNPPKANFSTPVDHVTATEI